MENLYHLIVKIAVRMAEEKSKKKVNKNQGINQ